MVFVRIKKVKNKEYAYLVKNSWNKGKVKQKTIKYLGRAQKYRSPPVSEFSKDNPLSSIIIHALLSAGFDDKLKKDGIVVNLERKKVLRGKGEAAIILNEGIISTHTINELLSYTPQEEKRPGIRLANVIASTGITLEKGCFINLYKVLHDT